MDVWQLIVAKDASLRIVLSEGFQQLVEGMLLSLGAGIVRSSSLIQATLIDDAKGTMVVVSGMNTLDTLGQQRDDIAAASDIVVIAALAEFSFAAGYQFLHAEGLIASCSRTMYNEQFYGFKWFH